MENKYIYQLNKSCYKKLSKEIQLLFKLSPKDFKELTNYEGTYGFSTSIYNTCRKLHKDNIAKYYYIAICFVVSTLLLMLQKDEFLG